MQWKTSQLKNCFNWIRSILTRLSMCVCVYGDYWRRHCPALSVAHHLTTVLFYFSKALQHFSQDEIKRDEVWVKSTKTPGCFYRAALGSLWHGVFQFDKTTFSASFSDKFSFLFLTCGSTMQQSYTQSCVTTEIAESSVSWRHVL